jgi:hypothetical protein
LYSFDNKMYHWHTTRIYMKFGIRYEAGRVADSKLGPEFLIIYQKLKIYKYGMTEYADNTGKCVEKRV